MATLLVKTFLKHRNTQNSSPNKKGKKFTFNIQNVTSPLNNYLPFPAMISLLIQSEEPFARFNIFAEPCTVFDKHC